MDIRHLTFFCILFLALAGLASAVTIHAPVNDYTYYTSITDFNITYNSSETCAYEINNQTREYFTCQGIFKIDVPYNSGNVNITIFQETDNATVSFNVDNEVSEGEGFIIGLLALLPFIISLIFLYSANSMDEEHTPLRLFSYLISMAFIIVGYNAADIITRNFIHFPLLNTVLGSEIYNWLFYTILAYFMLYITYKVFISFKDRRDPYKNG